MFKYNGESSFDVLMFNGSSLCEKEASYFQRKRERGVVWQARVTDPNTGKDDGVVAIPLSTPAAIGSAAVSHKARPRKEKLFCRRYSKIKTPKKKSVAANSWNFGDELMQESISKSPASYPIYKSNSRPVTVEEISSPYCRATDAVTSNGFLVVMRPTHVYKRFYLYLENQNQDMVLRLEDKMWNTKYPVTGCGTGGLSNGWKAFSMDNHLEESDVCVFDLAKSINETVVLDVTILRVVNDVVPLTAPQ
ncbi:hypothetical protein MLD38_034436 [Melastoma candidum]|uniref:Uncharacterized protein n=1 Tax=Melastoma candidum TaxID=119954 RepID=A0ACB9M9X0_9MYRT|nr:hypothetical protein MLD38_034436 [Melastoma candidum]